MKGQANLASLEYGNMFLVESLSKEYLFSELAAFGSPPENPPNQVSPPIYILYIVLLMNRQVLPFPYKLYRILY